MWTHCINITEQYCTINKSYDNLKDTLLTHKCAVGENLKEGGNTASTTQ